MDLIALKQEVENKNKKQNSTQKEDNFLEKIKQQEEVFEKNDANAEKQKSEPKFTPRVIVFDIEYTLQGENKSCKLTSKVMDASARQKYDRLLATLSAGLTFEHLPLETQNRYASLARIMAQTIDAPDWLLEASAEDLDFAYGLTMRLVEHEVRFFRNNSSNGESAEKRPRFSIDTTAFKD
jgi:hypothetical protein